MRKPPLCIYEKRKSRSAALLQRLISAFCFRCIDSIDPSSLLNDNFRTLIIDSSYAALFLSNSVGNSEGRFSRDKALSLVYHILMGINNTEELIVHPNRRKN